MLQLILGISGSGKSSWIMGEIKRRAEQGQKSLLLVPEQFTSSTEKRIFTALGDSLSGYVDSYSFSSLAEHILQTYGGAAIPTISDAGRAVLVRRAVESLGEQVQYYRRHRRSITFCRMAAETINELKSAGVSGEQLAQLAPQAGSGAEKLQELALILSTYEALLAGSAMDPGDRVQMAAERLVPEDLAGTAVFVDEFDTFNAPKRKLLGHLMQAADVTVALCADGMQDFEHGTGLFSGAKDVAGDLISLAHQIGTTAKKPIVLQEDRRHGPDSALERLNRLLVGEEIEPVEQKGEITLYKAADLGHIPETLDAVIFTTAGRMRLDDVEACFVMGLSEGEFPQAPGETGLLTHSDRDALIRQDIKMPDCFENRLIREKICFYKALTAAKSHLWLSWPGGSSGPELTSALDAVQECFAPQEPLLTTRDLAATPAMAMEELGHSFYENNAAAAAIFAALQERPEQKQAMDTLVRTAMEQPFQALDTKALEAVLGRGLRLSPSRVENFYTCRFAYFLQYVLRVRPRHKAELSPNQSGSLVHWVLEQAIKRSGEGFKTLPESKLRELAKSLAEEYARTNMPDTSERFQYLLRRLESNVADLLLFLQKDLCQSEFTPVAFEQPIGDGPGAVPPVRLKTPDGHEIRVVGTIDRVDAYRRGDTTWLRVVDYKTGTKSFKLEEVYCGLDCQMLLYLFTLTRNGKKQFENPAAAGVMYLMADPSPTLQDRKEAAQEKAYALDGLLIDDSSVVHAMDQNCTGLFVPVSFKKDGSLGSSKKLADAAKMGRICRRIDQLVVDMAAQLYKGQIQAEPLCKANGRLPCDYCDYRQVCRHEDGWNEKTVSMPEKYFDHDPIEKGEGNEQNQMDPGTENSH